MNLKLWPWDNGEKPYWVNPENGYEWYIDKETTDWCTRWQPNSNPLDAVVFIIAERNGETVKALERVLIDKETNEPLYVSASME